jgi:hypothetical protein
VRNAWFYLNVTQESCTAVTVYICDDSWNQLIAPIRIRFTDYKPGSYPFTVWVADLPCVVGDFWIGIMEQKDAGCPNLRSTTPVPQDRSWFGDGPGSFTISAPGALTIRAQVEQLATLSGSGTGVTFAVIALGAGGAAVSVRVALAASGPFGSGVYTYGGYCRKQSPGVVGPRQTPVSSRRQIPETLRASGQTFPLLAWYALNFSGS